MMAAVSVRAEGEGDSRGMSGSSLRCTGGRVPVGRGCSPRRGPAVVAPGALTTPDRGSVLGRRRRCRAGGGAKVDPYPSAEGRCPLDEESGGGEVLDGEPDRLEERDLSRRRASRDPAQQDLPELSRDPVGGARPRGGDTRSSSASARAEAR